MKSLFDKLSQFLNKMKWTRLAHLIFAPLIIIFYFFHYALSVQDYVIIAISFFIIDNLGVQVGFHKLLSHRSFKTRKIFVNLLGFLGLLSGQGSPLVWASIHRDGHHPFADTDKDPHTPNKGFFYSFFGWYWKIGAVQLSPVRDLFQFKFIYFMHKHHTLLLWLVFFIVYLLLGLKILIIVLFIPMLLSFTCIGLINSCLHSSKKSLWDYLLLTYRNYNTQDQSKNSLLLGLLTPLAYHNNHHKFPSKIDYSEKWYEVDFTRFFIFLINK